MPVEKGGEKMAFPQACVHSEAILASGGKRRTLSNIKN